MKANMEYIAVIDGYVNYAGKHKKTAENRIKGITGDRGPKVLKVVTGTYKAGDRYVSEALDGEILPPENATENVNMARTRARNKPDAPQVEDKSGEDQPVPDLDVGGTGNKADGSDTHGNKKTGTKKAKPWEKGQPHAEFLRNSAQELREISGRLNELTELREAASRTREDWVKYGDRLAQARAAIKSNNLFNTWLEEVGLLTFADRNTRTDAMWLSELPQDVLDQVPDTIHAPKAIRAWFRDRVNSIAEVLNSHEGELAEQIAILRKDDPVAAAFVTAVQAHDVRKGVAEDKRVIEGAIVRVQARKPRLDFSKLTVEAAVEWIIQKIGTHDDPEAVGASVVAQIEAGALKPKPEEEGDAGEADADTEAEAEEEEEAEAEEDAA